MHTVLLVTLVALVGSTAAYDFDFKNVIYPGTQRIVNRQFCDNSAAFALTGALEIANEVRVRAFLRGCWEAGEAFLLRKVITL